MLFRKLYEKPIFILVDTLYISKQNCRIWGSENPNIVLQKLKHPLPVTVWCDLYSEGIISPFFENEDCATKITAFFLYPPIYGFDMNYVWFQQDGATCHLSHAAIESRKDNVNYPPRSLNYFL